MTDPVKAGLQGRCPACGEGALFSGFLTFTSRCEACHADFSSEDAGDGPAVFVIFIVGIFVVPIIMAIVLLSGLPQWLTMSLGVLVIIAACLFCLRLLRGLMFGLQWKNKAREARSSDVKR